MRKAFLAPLLILAPLTLISAGEPPAANTPILIPTHATAEEVATELGGYIWTFNATLPASATGITIALQQSHAGTTTLLGSSVGFTPVGRRVKIVVSIIPIFQGADLPSKWFVALYIADLDQHTNTTSKGIIDNPFGPLATFGGPHATAEKVDDTTYNLLGSFTGNTIKLPLAGNADTILSLKTTTHSP